MAIHKTLTRDQNMNAYEWIQYYKKHQQRHATETYDWWDPGKLSEDHPG
jgi:hypothetical protein